MDWLKIFWMLVAVIGILGLGAFLSNPADLISKALRDDDAA